MVSDSKKSSKKSRILSSESQDSKVKEADTEKRLDKVEPPKPKPPVKQERLVTVDVWGRGNANPIVRVFISEHKSQRTVKRTLKAWTELFRYWKEKPRG